MRRSFLAGLAVLAGVGAIGCGAEYHPNDPRPPAGIKTSSDKARATLDEMVAATESKLDRIDSLVAEADESEGPDGSS